MQKNHELPALAGVDIAAKDRLSRRQQVICAANDADGENGRCPAASHPLLQQASVVTCPCREFIGKLRKNPAKSDLARISLISRKFNEKKRKQGLFTLKIQPRELWTHLPEFNRHSPLIRKKSYLRIIVLFIAGFSGMRITHTLLWGNPNLPNASVAMKPWLNRQTVLRGLSAGKSGRGPA